MNIRELFEKIQDTFNSDNISGEFTLQGNCIIWSYSLDNDSEELPVLDVDDDEYAYNFESESSEELLTNTCNAVIEQIEGLFDELDENDNWEFSDSEIIDDLITFKIF